MSERCHLTGFVSGEQARHEMHATGTVVHVVRGHRGIGAIGIAEGAQVAQSSGDAEVGTVLVGLGGDAGE